MSKIETVLLLAAGFCCLSVQASAFFHLRAQTIHKQVSVSLGQGPIPKLLGLPVQTTSQNWSAQMLQPTRWLASHSKLFWKHSFQIRNHKLGQIAKPNVFRILAPCLKAA